MPKNSRTSSAAPTTGILAGLFAWLALLAVGLAALWDFSGKPGLTATAPADWPENPIVALHRQRPTLVVLLHPKCPCSRATLGELARLMTQCSGRVAAHALLVSPPDAGHEWETDRAMEAAVRSIPGVAVHIDRGGGAAERFGAFTSGQTLLYDPSGRLLFRGGITRSRGEEGDNVGRDQIVALIHVAGRNATAGHVPVYGCPLFTCLQPTQAPDNPARE